MSSNGNGKWFRSAIPNKPYRENPRKPGWYAAVPEDCNKCVLRVFLDSNLLDVRIDGVDLRYDVYDFTYWYPLKNPYDTLPSHP